MEDSVYSSDPGRLAAGGYKKGSLFMLFVVHLPGRNVADRKAYTPSKYPCQQEKCISC